MIGMVTVVVEQILCSIEFVFFPRNTLYVATVEQKAFFFQFPELLLLVEFAVFLVRTFIPVPVLVLDSNTGT